VVSAAGALTFANAAARSLFGIEAGHVGRPFADLELSRSPAELRGPIADALRDRRVVTVGEIGHQGEQGPERRLEVTVTPLVSGAGAPLGASVLFDDVSRYAAVEGELQRNQRDLERAYEQLRSTIDELETTNEELQSANEALQIANEELQSTNEELETMNEEIQSTNDELETINDELRARTGELDRVNDHLEAILGSIGVGVAVLDREQRVQVWNARAEELWGMRSDEAAGRHFLALDIGLPAEAVAPALRGVLSGRSPREELVIDAVNRRGSPIACTATVMPLAGSGQAVRGAVVLMAGRAPGDEPDPAPRVSSAAPP
jgi:two-component system CheB/CheR fusion protein